MGRAPERKRLVSNSHKAWIGSPQMPIRLVILNLADQGSPALLCWARGQAARHAGAMGLANQLPTIGSGNLSRSEHRREKEL